MPRKQKNQSSNLPVGDRNDILQFWRICLLLALSTFIVYLPVLHHGFVEYDDFVYVTQNPHVLSGLSRDALTWVWTSNVALNWHPITMLSHLLDVQLFGVKPGWHHLTSLLLHVANTLLLFAVLRKITGAVWRSALVAALFALHPLHVESVAWAAERKDVLSTFFWLLTIWAYAQLRNVEWSFRTGTLRNVKRAGFYYGLALLYCVLGLMSKPMVVTLPFTLLLLDFWPLRRVGYLQPDSNPLNGISGHPSENPQSAIRNPQLKGLGFLVLEKLPLFLMSAMCSWIAYHIQQQGGVVRAGSALPLGARVSNALVSYVRYLCRTFWPQDLAALYIDNTWRGWEIALAAVLLLAITAAVIWAVRRHPYLAVGWFWFLGTLVPVIGLVQVGMQSMADRYSYVPSIGIFIMLAWGAGDLAARWRVPAPVLGAVSGVALAACAVLTHFQLGSWQDSETLFHRMIAVTKGNFVAHEYLGNYYLNQGKLEAAATEYSAALTIKPEYQEALESLALTRQKQGKLDEAVSAYRELVRRSPQPHHYSELAGALVEQGKSAEAIPFYEQVMTVNTNDAGTRLFLAQAYEKVGQPQKAVALLERDLGRDDEERTNRYVLLGYAYRDLQDYPKTAETLRAGLQRLPGSPRLLEDLAFVEYSKLNDLTNAYEHFQRLLVLEPNHPRRAEYTGVLNYLAGQLGKPPVAPPKTNP